MFNANCLIVAMRRGIYSDSRDSMPYVRDLREALSERLEAFGLRGKKRKRLVMDMLVKKFVVTGGDFCNAGRISTDIKAILKSRNIDPEIIRRLAIASSEAEMNIIMYARKGTIALHLCRDMVMLKVKDEGQGIPNLDLAMIEGFSTASDEMRGLGFGAGMGLPNIKRNADELKISSEIGVGTNFDIYL